MEKVLELARLHGVKIIKIVVELGCHTITVTDRYIFKKMIKFFPVFEFL